MRGGVGVGGDVEGCMGVGVCVCGYVRVWVTVCMKLYAWSVRLGQTRLMLPPQAVRASMARQKRLVPTTSGAEKKTTKSRYHRQHSMTTDTHTNTDYTRIEEMQGQEVGAGGRGWM